MKIIQRIFSAKILALSSCRKSIKKLPYLISLFLLFSMQLSCTDDTNEVFVTFLEKNHKTEWILADPDLIVYIRINDDETHLIEQWSYNDRMDCYEYNANIFLLGDYQILENSENLLVVGCDPVLGDCDKLSFHREGTSLQVDVTVSEWEEEIVYFTKSLVPLDDLETCDNEEGNNDFKFYK